MYSRLLVVQSAYGTPSNQNVELYHVTSVTTRPHAYARSSCVSHTIVISWVDSTKS